MYRLRARFQTVEEVLRGRISSWPFAIKVEELVHVDLHRKLQAEAQVNLKQSDAQQGIVRGMWQGRWLSASGRG